MSEHDKVLALVCQKEFEAFGHRYQEGRPIPAAHFNAWPGNTLVNRLNYGFVKYDQVDAALLKEAEAADEAPTGVEAAIQQLNAMNKPQVVAWAREKGLQVDSKLDEAALKAALAEQLRGTA